MRFLIIGLGSMGKRRVRCLQALKYFDIIGFDLRDDRRQETEKLYGITTIDNLDATALSDCEAMIISVPPDLHLEYMQRAVETGKPAFVEASVVLEGLEKLNQETLDKNVFIAPSCTLRFHPAIQIIKKILIEGHFGKFTNFSYHSGQFLPDWHPWEKVTDYYVSNPMTGGAREIVPFELTWLVDLIGYPIAVSGLYGSTMEVGAQIDDTYALSFQFDQGYGTMLVDVVSRSSVRSLIMNMEHGQILWNWDEPHVKLYNSGDQKWTDIPYQASSAHEGYNKNIIEDMYINEIQSFLNGLTGQGSYPNSLADDIEILRILYLAENRPVDS